MLQPNSNKELNIEINNQKYARYPVKTKLVTPEDKDIIGLIYGYIKDLVQPNDIVFISEKLIAIMQGRAYPINQIKPSWWAKKLSKFVHKNPAGIGLSIPETMHLAIEEVGLWRILIAAFFSAITKVIGIKGMFYHIAGRQAAAIDGPVDYAIPPYNTYASKGPIEVKEIIKKLEDNFDKIKFAVVDANDLGIDVLGCSRGVEKKFLKEVLKDNPLGQSDEATPIGILRKVKSKI